jgi:hypothetical protein
MELLFSVSKLKVSIIISVFYIINFCFFKRTSLYFSGIKSVNPDDSPLVEHPELSTSENLHEKGAGDRARVGRLDQPKEFSSSRLGLGEEKFGSGRFDRSRPEEEENGRERRQRFSFDRIFHDADEELSFDQVRSGRSRDSESNFVRLPTHRASENERVRSKDSDSERLHESRSQENEGVRLGFNNFKRLTRSGPQESQRFQPKENQEKEHFRSKRFKLESLDRSTSSENKRFGSKDDNLERLSRFGPQENKRFRSKENHFEREKEDESRESSAEESEEEEPEERLQSRKRHFVRSHSSRHQESLHRSRPEENEQLQSRVSKTDRVSRSRHQKDQRPHRRERLRGFRPEEEEVEEELLQSRERNLVRSHPSRRQEDLSSSRPEKNERHNSERTSRSGSEDERLKSRESNSEKSREEEEDQEERLQSKERNIVRSHPSRHQESLHRSLPEEKEHLQSRVNKSDKVSRSRRQKDESLHPKERLRGARPEEREDEVEEELLQSRERHFLRSHPSRRQEGLGRSRLEENERVPSKANNSEGTSRSGSEDERLRSQAWARHSHSSRNQEQEPKSRFEVGRKSDRSSSQYFGNRRTEISENFRSKSIPEPEKN